MEIRRAALGDAERILDLASELYLEDGDVPFIRESAAYALATLLSDESVGEVWVADSDGDIVGYLILTWGFSLEFHGRDAFIDEVFVSPQHRGQGLGSQLIELAESSCRAHDVRALHLEVERGNDRARELYRRFGFIEHSRLLMSRLLDGGT